MTRPALLAPLLAAFLAAAPAHAFDLQGHRGARGLAPENTLPAFRKALEIGVDTIECDMAITKDDVVVIHHDLRLNPDTTRGPDGQWLDKPGPNISDLTFDELQKYDVGRIKPGTKYAQDFPDQQPADGTRIPRLSDLFDLVKKSGNAEGRLRLRDEALAAGAGRHAAPGGVRETRGRRDPQARDGRSAR